MVSGHRDQAVTQACGTSLDKSSLHKILVEVVASIFWLAGLSQGSQAELKELTLEQLSNLEVTTVSKGAEKLSHTPAAVYVLTQEDIRRSGATSIPEVLRLVPGVEVARIDSDHWAVGIRGLRSQFSKSLLVLIDGRSVYTPLYAGVYWNVQNVPLEDIDRIEVVRGPGGTIWGANAVNGVINIITKSAQQTHGTLLSFGGGNVDQGTVGFRYGDGNGKGFNYRLYGMGFTRGPEFHPDARNFDRWHIGQGGFRFDWSANSRDSYTLQGDTYKGETSGVGSFGTYSPPYQAVVYGDVEVSGENVLGRWKRTLSEGSDIQVQAYYDRTNRHDTYYGETRDTFDIDFLHHFTPLDGHDFIWGLGTRVSPDNFITVVPTVDFLPHHRTDEIFSGFVQDEISFAHDHVRLTVGSKFEHNNYTGFEVQPDARLWWTRGPRQTFWAAVTRAVRTPSRLDDGIQATGLVSTKPLTFARITGDGKFFSEQSIGYEAGYRALVTPHFYVDVATFHNDYNYLYSYEIGAPFLEVAPVPHVVIPIPIRNGIRGTTSGFEVAPDWTLTGWWQLKGSYSYLNTNLKRRPGSPDTSTVAADEGSSPQHQVVVQSLLNLPQKLELDLTYRYVSSLPAQQLSGYGTADARLGWRPVPYFELSVAGQNLLQPRHAEFRLYPGPLVELKRSAYGKITLRW